MMDEPLVRAEHAPVDMDDIAPIIGFGAQLLHQRSIIAVGDEADVLAVGLARNPEPQIARDLAHHALFESAQGKAQEVELRSEEHTSELQSLMRISYAVFCLKKKNHRIKYN